MTERTPDPWATPRRGDSPPEGPAQPRPGEPGYPPLEGPPYGEPGHPPPYGAPGHPSPEGPAQPPYGQYPPPYGAPPGQGDRAYGAPYGVPSAAARNGFGTAALVLGILAVVLSIFVIGGVLGVLAIAFGIAGRVRASRGRASNGGAALAGAILGAVGVAVTVAVIVSVVRLLGSGPIDHYRACLERAGSDRASVNACADQLRREIRRDLPGR